MRKINILTGLVFLIGLPAIMVFVVESIHRGGVLVSFQWIREFNNEFIVNYLIAFGIINIFFIMKKKVYFSIFSLLLLAISAAAYTSHMKLIYRNEPLMPWDLSLGKEAVKVSEYFKDMQLIHITVFIIGFLIVSILIIYLLPGESRIKKRYVIVTIVSILLFKLVYTDRPFQIKYNLKILEIPWDQVEHYNRNGFMLGFTLNSKWISVEEPHEYGEKRINNIVREAIARQNVESRLDPNIIFIMSEAFWDPTFMEEVRFENDPLPYFHYLQKNYTSGTLMSPVFGGGTANTEFEALTGLSSHFLPAGATAYTQYINRPTESMASILKSQGYITTAIHTYHGWFYRRNEVYKHLGFDKFISAEKFEDPEYRGQFISDNEITNRIVSELKVSENQDFIFAVTMQNHGPYSKNENVKYKEDIVVQGELSSDSKEILETYAKNLYEADMALKSLIQSLQEIDEPTILVFFGDHLPFLGQSYQVYKEADYISDGASFEEYEKLHSVPFVIWDNFIGQQKEMRISPNFLGPYVLNMSKKSGNTIMNYVYSLYDSGTKVITKSNFYKEENLDPEQLKTYKLLQYDVLFGKRYIYGDTGT